jgi:hypothetical protein
MQRYFEGHDSVVAVADITPAYTNAQSGSGEFSHRSRRVERMWRTFVYDRASDVVIVRDLVKSTRAEFRKRWLLHTQSEPRISGQEFFVALPAGPSAGQTGGTLAAQVVLPHQARLQKVGGPGFEFFVDGRNYDEDGSLAAAIAKKSQPTEPGSWRMEVSPATPQQDDEFLVVLIPRSAQATAQPRIRELDGNHEHGVEITTAAGVRRWWFSPERNGVRLELGQTSEHIFPPAEGDAANPSLWHRIRAWWQDMFD